MKDFFVSYNRADRRKAEWIAWQLEEAGHEVVIQAWDFRPGRNWVLDMQKASAECERTLIVLSPSFLDAEFTQPEWAAAFREDPTGEKGLLVPVRVRHCEPKGILGGVTWIDLVGLHSEVEARRVLLDGVDRGRAKPKEAPPYEPVAREKRTIREKPSYPFSGVMAIPDPPPHFLPRPEYTKPLKAALLKGAGSKIGITGTGRIGVQGMGGIGKTVLAAALLRDDGIRRAFPEALWVTVSQSPDLVGLQIELASALGEEGVAIRSVHEGKRRLRDLCKNRAVLLVLDDVWASRDAAALDVIGSRGRVLITTRNAEVLGEMGAAEHPVKELEPDRARALLADWAGVAVMDLPTTADQVAKGCGYLPLALAMIGAMVRLRPTAWEDALHRLEDADLEKIRAQFPDYPYPNLLAAIEVSVNALDPDVRTRYLDLAVFPEDVPVPESTLETYWSAEGLDEYDVRGAVDLFVARSLARRDAAGRLVLHDLQADYVRAEAEDTAALHRRLVAAYQARCTNGYASGPDDGYFFKHLPMHLAAAGAVDELRELLLDFCWLEAKLRIAGINGLVSDYDFLPEQAVTTVQAALRLASHVLVRSPGQLRGQLWGRLPHGGAFARILTSAEQSAQDPWLKPLVCNLARPGGGLLRILEGHTGGVTSVAVLPDGRVISGSGDCTLRVWDLESGESLRTLEGHARGVTSAAVLRDGRVVSGSEDCTLRVWDLESGKSLRTLEGHTEGVLSIAVLPDGRVVSGSSDETLEVWDLESGETVRTLKGYTRGHTGWVTSVAVLPDGRLVSGSLDETLRVWDLESGKTLRTLKAHSGGVASVAVLPDGRVISGSRLECGVAGRLDEILRVWDLEGETVRTLTGHTGEVSSIAVLPGGRFVSGSDDGTLRVWDPESDQTVGTLERHTEGVSSIAVLPDGRVVTGSDDAILRVWDPESGETVATLGAKFGRTSSVAVLADGRIVEGSWGLLRVWDLESGESVRTLEGHAVEGRACTVTCVASLRDGRVVSGSSDETLRIWDLRSGETMRILKGHVAWVTSVAALSDGRIVSGSSDKTLRIWDPESGETVCTLEGHTGAVGSVVVLPDGWIVSGSSDETLRIWDPESGETVRTLEGHTGAVWSVAVLPDGRVVSGSSDSTLCVWDSGSGEAIAFIQLDAPISAVSAVSADLIVAGDVSGGVHFLRVEEPGDATN